MSDDSAKKPIVESIQRVVERISARQQLLDVAREIFAGFRSARKFGSAEYLGEKEVFSSCNDPADPNTTIQFNCSAGFDCTKEFGTFNCEDTYARCGASTSDYNCKADFGCKDQVFDCWDFVCGDDGAGKGSFNCKTTFDFMCNGPAFQCHDDFDCTSGHIFSCSNQHECNDTFECFSAGNPACDKINQYDRDGDGKGDTAGDFACGYVNSKYQNVFGCNFEFVCNSIDEFDCAGSKNNFDCTGTFQCGASSFFLCTNFAEFDCEGTFNCKDQDGFGCLTSGGYNCMTGTTFNCAAGAGNYTNIAS